MNDLNNKIENLMIPEYHDDEFKAKLKDKILNSSSQNIIYNNSPKIYVNIKKYSLVIACFIIFISISLIYIRFGAVYNLRNNITFTGNVYYQKKKGFDLINNISGIKKNDRIRTDNLSELKINIDGGSSLTIYQNSDILINDFSTRNNNLYSIIYLANGKISCDVQLPGKNSVFEILIDSCKVSVTGTKFSVEKKNNEVTVNVTEGTVKVENFNKKKVVFVPKNNTYIIDKNIIDNSSDKTDNKNIDQINIDTSKDTKIINNNEQYDINNEISKDLQSIIDSVDWKIFAENDFSKTLSGDNFASFVINENGGKYDISGYQCIYNGDNKNSDSILLTNKLTAKKGINYHITLDIKSLTDNVMIKSGFVSDSKEFISADLSLNKLEITDQSGSIVKSISHDIKDFSNIEYSIYLLNDNFIVSLIDKTTSKHIKDLTYQIHPIDKFESLVKCRGKGKAVFDDLKIYKD